MGKEKETCDKEPGAIVQMVSTSVETYLDGIGSPLKKTAIATFVEKLRKRPGLFTDIPDDEIADMVFDSFVESLEGLAKALRESKAKTDAQADIDAHADNAARRAFPDADDEG